uniref:SET domain-containing protein n=1 Tax=Cyclophora tenuis TaxID=216820 RepID=A0A7S1GRS0_CYCTE
MSVVPIPWRHDKNYDIKDYVWNGGTYKVEYEAAPNISTVIMAVNDGALANSHTGLVNEKLSVPTYNPILDRCSDPGAGAFSDYVDYSFMSARAVGAGEELFVEYGDQWFEDRAQFADVPLSNNFIAANRVAASLWQLTALDGGLNAGQTEDLMSTIRESFVGEHRTKMALSQIEQIDDLKVVLERNGTAQATVKKRSQEWFDKHGQCLDHIYVKASTIPQAGNGAFARRFLPEGTTIISSPLVATYGRELFEVDPASSPDGINPTMLFLNYQLFHPNSSVYFFPINHALMINHNSARRENGQTPNARLRWSSRSKKALFYLARPLEDLKEEHYSTMVLDFVATRDIQVDEEVFIDYGIEWENAWYKHVAEFKSPCMPGQKKKSSKFVKSMNRQKFETTYHQWSDDHFTVCNDDSTVKWLRLLGEASPGLKDAVVAPYHGITKDHLGFNISYPTSRRRPCLILNSFPEHLAFDVMLFATGDTFESHDFQLLKRIPSLRAENIEFIDKPFRSDMFWPGAFRHAMKIPDDVFPVHWKDVVD